MEGQLKLDAGLQHHPAWMRIYKSLYSRPSWALNPLSLNFIVPKPLNPKLPLNPKP